MSSMSKEWKLRALLKAFRFLIWQKIRNDTRNLFKKENGHIRINVDDLAKVIEVLELPQDKCGIFLLTEFPKCQQNKNKHLKRRNNKWTFKKQLR